MFPLKIRDQAAGFERELAAQQERARQSSRMGAVKGDPVFMKLADEGVRTDFLAQYLPSPGTVAYIGTGVPSGWSATTQAGSGTSVKGRTQPGWGIARPRSVGYRS